MAYCKFPTNSILTLTLAWALTLSLVLCGVCSHLSEWLWASLGLLSVLVASEAVRACKPLMWTIVTEVGLILLLINAVYGLVLILKSGRMAEKGDFAVLTAVIVYFLIAGLRLLLCCLPVCLVFSFSSQANSRISRVLSEVELVKVEELFSVPDNSLSPGEQGEPLPEEYASSAERLEPRMSTPASRDSLI